MKSMAEIAARLQGYDPQALSADSVNAFLAELVSPVEETEEVALPAALGRVLAHDLVSPFSVPPHDNSAMDGFALTAPSYARRARSYCGWLAPRWPARPGRGTPAAATA